MLLRLATVAITAVVAHILSPKDFGVFAVALTAYVIVSVFGELGVSSCLIRADLDIDSLAPTVVTISILAGAIFAGAMFALARPIAVALGSAVAVGPIRILAIGVFFIGVFAVPSAQMARDFRQDKIFLANAIGFVPSTALLVVLAKSGDGAMAFAWSMVIRQLIVGCVLVVAAPKYYRPRLARSALSLVFRFGIPLAGANLVNYLLLNVDYAFVGHLLGAAKLGVYMLAFTIASWPYGVFGAVINGVAMPAFSRVKHDPVLLKNAMVTGVRGVCLVTMPMCAITIALARPIVLTLYGDRWAAAASVLVILSVYGAVFIQCLLFANVLTALGRTKLLLILQLIWVSTLVPAMVMGVRQDGIIGASYAHVAVIVPIVLPSYLLALRHVTGASITTLGKAALRAVVAASAAALAASGAASLFASPLLQLLVGLAAGGFLYLVCVGQQVVALFAPRRIADRVQGFYRVPARLTRLTGLTSGGGRGKHRVEHAGAQLPAGLKAAESGQANGSAGAGKASTGG